MGHVQKVFKYQRLHKYPGMRPHDVAIWNQYIKNHPNAHTRVWYDVPLGDPFPDATEHDHVHKTGAFDVSRWRIDVLAESENGIAIIELKPNAGASALGQALAYEKLIRKEWKLEVPTIPVVLTDTLSPITEEAARLLGVLLLVP